MPISGAYPALVYLTSCVQLPVENTHALAMKPYTCVYDSVFSCSRPTTDTEYSEGIGSFHHYVGQDVNKKKDGMYKILVKVISFWAQHP